MATNLHIDDTLLAEAVKANKGASKRATVERALREFIAYSKQVKVLELAGKIEYLPGCDPVSIRKRERVRAKAEAKKWA